MNKIILLLIFSFPIYCLSQDWATGNSVWHYEQTDFGPPFNHDYIKFSVIGDTIVFGDTAKIIKEEYISINHSTSSNIIMKSDSNRVFIFEPSINSFKLIYDFNAKQKDTIEVYCRNAHKDSTILITVDSISTIEINGVLLKVQHVHQLNDDGDEFNMHGEIIENIGWKGFMFPLHAWADPPYGGALRCFQNDEVGLYKNSNKDCDYITSIESKDYNKSVKIFPNPTNGIIKIQAQNIQKIEILELNGKNVYNGNESEINLSNVNKGIYIIKVVTADRTVIEKIILQ